MISTILWLMVIGIASLVLFVVGGIIYASIYDWWYWRKYGFWVMLKEDHNDNDPPGPLAK